jgi:hypothetical protein
MITLKSVLFANSASCIGFGALFASLPAPLAHFLYEAHPAPALVIQLIGIGLVLHGFHLLWGAQQATPSKPMVLYFSMGDFSWVIGTVLLILLGVGIGSAKGIATASIVALMVGTLGVFQIKKLPTRMITCQTDA